MISASPIARRQKKLALSKTPAMRGLETRDDIAPQSPEDSLATAFFWLTAFYFVYCARPHEIIPGLGKLPLAKLTSGFALLSLCMSIGRSQRRLSDLPREAYCLLAMISLLFVSAVLSPVWRGGAFFVTLDFAKVFILWLLGFLVITNEARFRRIIFIQASSVALISLIALVKGHSVERLDSVVGGIYSNPNDLAFAIVLSMPFCLAFMLDSPRLFAKGAWCLAMFVMAIALLLTASRAGFLDLVISGAVCLWHLGVKGRRTYLIAMTACLGVVLVAIAGGKLKERFAAMGDNPTVESRSEESAAESYEERKALITKSIEAIATHPILGLGADNFVVYSDMWREVHVSYLQIAVEGGIPVLILYLLFFQRGFANLRELRTRQLDPRTELYTGALHASLVGFVVGAAFAPQAYLYFPYLTVLYTSVLYAVVHQRAGNEDRSTEVNQSRAMRRMRLYRGKHPLLST
jgi:O-antigen ligase